MESETCAQSQNWGFWEEEGEEAKMKGALFKADQSEETGACEK